jgi:hypothetical protein
MSATAQKRCRLAGGISRDVGRGSDEPSEFYLAVDRGLASGKLDYVVLDERDLLRLIKDAAQALELLRADR